MADYDYQTFEDITQKLAEQTDGTFASVYQAAPAQALSTDYLFQVFQDGINKKLALQADGTYAEVVQIIGNQSNVTLIPAMIFTGSATGGANQSFTNTNLGFYDLAVDIQLFVDKVKLIGQPLGSEFSLDKGADTITIANNIAANAQVFIDSKVIGQITQTYYYLLEDGIDRFLSEDGLNLFILE